MSKAIDSIHSDMVEYLDAIEDLSSIHSLGALRCKYMRCILSINVTYGCIVYICRDIFFLLDIR
jgi:hypothetical protein